MGKRIALLKMFPGCEKRIELCGGLDKAFVTFARVDTRERSLLIRMAFPAQPSHSDLAGLKKMIADDYALHEVTIEAEYPQERKAQQETEEKSTGLAAEKSPVISTS